MSEEHIVTIRATQLNLGTDDRTVLLRDGERIVGTDYDSNPNGPFLLLFIAHEVAQRPAGAA